VTDLVGQLRDLQTNGDAWAILDLTPAVITEIETLRAEIEQLRKVWAGTAHELEAADTEIKTLRAELQAAQAALVRQAGIMHRFGDKQ
jgi:predicted  nucleic acid-binding Zn-ribbon protein